MFFIKIVKNNNNKNLYILFLIKIFLICSLSKKFCFILSNIIDSVKLNKTTANNLNTSIKKNLNNLNREIYRYLNFQK